MSLPSPTSTVRTPLKDISSNAHNNIVSGTPHHQPYKISGDTPKTSPGPALLLGIRLSAKKLMSKSTPGKATNTIASLQDSSLDSKSSEGVMRFRKLLSSEIQRITQICQYWNDVLQFNAEGIDSKPPGDFVLGEIRSTVGQARLIMKERFHQFEGLVDNCEFGTSEKTVTCQDLQGFWEMIYFQVEDVDKKFVLLKNCQSSNWDENALKPTKEPSSIKKTKKKVVNKPLRAKTTATKSRNEEFAKKRAEAHRRLLAAKAEMKKSQQQSDKKTFDAVFFKVDSPVKSPRKRADFANTSIDFSASKPSIDNLSSSLTTTESVSVTNQDTLSNEVNEPLEPAKLVITVDGTPMPDPPHEQFSNTSPQQSKIASDILDEESHFVTIAQNISEQVSPWVELHVTPKNHSRVSLSSNVSLWSNISMSEVANQLTTQCIEPDNESTDVGNELGHISGKVNTMEQQPSLQSGAVSKIDPSRDVTNSDKTRRSRKSQTYFPISPLTQCTVSTNTNETCQFGAACEGFGTPNAQLQKESVDVSVLIDTAAKNIEMASELLSETPQRQIKDKRIRSLVDQGTSFSPQVTKDEESMTEALHKILKHMAIFQNLSEHHFTSGTDSERDTVIEKLQEEVEALKLQNEKQNIADESLTCEKIVECLYDTTEMPEAPDILYKPHYLRLLAKVKMLQIEFVTYEKCGILLKEKAEKLRIAVDAVKAKKIEVDKKETELNNWAKEQKEKKDAEKEELARCKVDLKELASRYAEKEKMVIDMSARIEQDIPVMQILKERNELLEVENSKLEQECSEKRIKINVLEEDLERATELHQSEVDKANTLQVQLDVMQDKVYSAFQEFEANIQATASTIDCQKRELEAQHIANTKLAQKCRQLKDRMETLEYVEEEMKSLQDQLVETENLLANSKLNEEDNEKRIVDLTASLARRDEKIEEMKMSYATLQERCDVLQADTHLILQTNKEELIDGLTGVDQILEQMKNFLSTLTAVTSQLSSANTCNTAHLKSEDTNSPAHSSVHVEKNKDSMSWKVDQANTLFKQIMNECAKLNTQYKKDIEKLELEKLVSERRITDMKQVLSVNVNKESELEEVLRKRISDLVKECEEKSTKLEDLGKVMRMLSDKNLKLLEYKMKHQEPLGGLRGYNRGSTCRRRSSSSNR